MRLLTFCRPFPYAAVHRHFRRPWPRIRQHHHRSFHRRCAHDCAAARGSILTVRKQEYIEAAEKINCSKFRVITSHILPNSIAPLIVSVTMGIGNTILQAASLSYIGLGVQPPTPEWGAMLSAGKAVVMKHPHLCLFPGLCIMLVVLSFNMLGDGLRDAMDPKLKN